jgi:hypothetical protein
MARYRFSRDEAGHLIREALDTVPDGTAFSAAAAASVIGGVEAYRRVDYDQLPSYLKEQLRTDGMRDARRSDVEAEAFFEQAVPAEARGSIEGIDAVVNTPEIEAMHIVSHENGGSTDPSNLVYGPESLNARIQEQTMTPEQIQEAKASTLEVAEIATPGVTGDLVDVAGDTLETGALGGVMGGGLAAVHRLAQAQGYRDAGRHDLAAQAEAQIGRDAAKGAVNGVLRGTSVAVTQAVLGANPLTAGIGLVAPDVVALLSQKDRLSEREYGQKAMAVVGKGALATVLVCAGPLGWMGLAGVSIASAYGKANQQRGGGEQPA